MPSDHVWIMALAVVALCVMCVFVTAGLALALGRGLRARSVARLGKEKELGVRVEVAGRRGPRPRAAKNRA